MTYSNRFWYSAVAAIMAVALLLLLPGIKAGLMADDYWHAVWVQNTENNPVQQSPASPFGLFAFIDNSSDVRDQLISKGALPWWAASDLKVRFWRPVAELTHLDYRWFSDSPAMLHVHSLLWYAVLLWLMATYYRRILGNDRVALLALLLLVAEPFHAVSVSWLANRNIIISAVFALACLIWHFDYRQTGARWRQYASLASLLLALLSAESGISAVAFLLAAALFLDRRSGALASVVPHIVLVVLWFVVYKLLGYGAAGSGQMYVDPLSDPRTYVIQFFERIPLAVMLQVTVLPKLFPETFTNGVLMAGGLVLLSAFLLVLYRSRHPILLFCLLALVGSLVPLASALLHERNFTFVSLAIAPVLALLLDYCWRNGVAGSAWLSKSLFVALVAVRVVLTAALVPLACWYMLYINGGINKTALSLVDEVVHDQHMISVGMPIMHSTFFYPIRLFNDRAVPLSHLNLVSDQSDVLIMRESEQQWLLSSDNGLLAGEDLFLRDPLKAPFVAGQMYQVNGISIRILEVNEQGNPLQLQLTLPVQNTGHYPMFYWQKNTLQTLDINVGDFYQLQGLN